MIPAELSMPSGPGARAGARLIRWPPAGAILALLALSSHAQASLPQRQEEAGRYSFEASLDAGHHGSLESDPLSPLLAGDRPVEIQWVARELPGLRGYRLTTVIEGGVLAGTVVRWTVEPGTGRRLDAGGLRAYRLRLPLLKEPGIHLHTALEAIHRDGSSVLLTKRDAIPEDAKGEGRFAPSRSGRLSEDPARSAGGAVAPGGDAGLAPASSGTTRPVAPGSAGAQVPRPTTRAGTRWSRGPPSA